MTNFISGLVTGIIIGGVGIYFLLPRKSAKETKEIAKENEVDLPEHFEIKAENITKLKDYIKTKDRFTNDELQNYLKVSDTTIGRYLDELEKEKIIKQVGKTGRSVYYEKT